MQLTFVPLRFAYPKVELIGEFVLLELGVVRGARIEAVLLKGKF